MLARGWRKPTPLTPGIKSARRAYLGSWRHDLSSRVSQPRGANPGTVRSASAERVALLGMLLVVLPITISIFPAVAHAVVPPTLLVVVGYWWVGKALRGDAALVPYALLGGALAGCLNASASLHLHLWPSARFEALAVSGLYSALLGFFGCVHGVAYGLMLLPPLWLARRSRRFHPAEGTDRALAGTGLWGLAALAIAALLADHVAIGSRLDLTRGALGTLWMTAALVCLLMLVLGVERLRERRSWLARVRAGKVAGWQVIASERFGRELDELPVFCPRLLGREPAARFVLAEGEAGRGAYRSEGLIPRFRVV